MDGVLLQHKSSWRYCQEEIGIDHMQFYNCRADFLYDSVLNELVMREMISHGFNQYKLHELARNAPQMKGIADVLKAIKANNGSAFIISGGIGVFAEELMRQYPFSGYMCNELRFDGYDQTPKWEIGVRYYDKGKIAKSFQDLMGVSKEETFAIGDNSNDCTMFAEAGLSIAFNGNKAAKMAANYNVDSDDLRAILPIIHGKTDNEAESHLSNNLRGKRLLNERLSESENACNRISLSVSSGGLHAKSG